MMWKKEVVLTHINIDSCFYEAYLPNNEEQKSIKTDRKLSFQIIPTSHECCTFLSQRVEFIAYLQATSVMLNQCKIYILSL